MSRIGKLPVAIPQGVTVTVADGVVTVKGAKGTLSQTVRPEITVEVKGNEVVLTRCNDEKEVKGYHGLYRQLIHNMIVGVSQGYSKTLLINGVGFKAEAGKGFVTLSLGYSTQIEFMIPQDVTITVDGGNKLVIAGISKERVGQIAAEIRSLRGPEPYKGKGIKYETENIRRKVGKSGGKK
jgi:large subunit ribosomal protein L6